MKKQTITYFPAILILIIAGIIPFVTASSLMDVALLSKFLVITCFLIIFFLVRIIQKEASFDFNIIDLVFSLYIIWHVLSIFWAYNFSEAVFSTATVFLFYFSYLAIKLTLASQKGFEQWFIFVVAIGSLVLTFYGWYEFFSISDFKYDHDVYDIKGFSAHKNLFSTQLFLLLPFLCIGFFSKQTKLRWFYVLIFALQILLLFSLLSRAFLLGILGAALIAGTLFFLKRNLSHRVLKPFLFIIPGVAISVLIIYSLTGGTELLQRYNFKNFNKSRNAKERIQIWKNTVDLVKDKPVLGYGAGNWDIFFPSKGINKIRRMAVLNETVARPHNDYLWIAAETGIIGLLIYLSLFVLIYFYSVKAIIQSTNRIYIIKLIFLISFFTGYLIIAFFDFPRERAELNFYVACIIAWILYLINQTESLKKILTLNYPYQKLWMASTVVLLIGILYVGLIRYNSEVQVKYTKALFQNKAWDKVIAASQKVKHPLYTIDPTELPVDYYACYAYFNKKDYPNTIEYGKRAIEDSPYHQSSLLQIATAYAEMKNFNKGATYYEQALQMHPTNNRILESLAICYYNSNQIEKAKEVVKRVKSNHPSIKKMRETFGL